MAPKPVNVLVGGPIGLTVAELAEIGVRRISVGGALARAAWAGFMRAREIAGDGRFDGFAGAAPFADSTGSSPPIKITGDGNDRQTRNAAAPALGPLVDATPAPRPGPVRLEGRFGLVEKLDPPRHAVALWQALKDHDGVWTYMAFGAFADAKSFAGWLDERATLQDPYAYVVVDGKTGRASGIVTLMEIRPPARVIEMGNIVYAPVLQRTAAATEAQFMLARYVFDELGYRRYEWKCNALNAPSIRAAVRLGFTSRASFRQHMIVKGRNRDTAWFSMLDSEWPARKAAFERWLRPKISIRGQQRQSLSALNAAAREKAR